MKDGILSKRDMDQIRATLKILDEWIEWQEENDLTVDELVYYSACSGAERLRDVLNDSGDSVRLYQ